MMCYITLSRSAALFTQLETIVVYMNKVTGFNRKNFYRLIANG